MERRRGEERGGKGALPSLYDLHRSGNRFPVDQEIKSEYSVRAMCGHRKLQVLPRFRAVGS